jgi:hypothetical protein
MVFASGKFTSLKWLRLLAVLAKSTTQWARGTCDLSVEAETSLPRLKTNILCDGRSVFVSSFPCRPFLGFEGAGVEAGCCSPSNDNAFQMITIRRGFKDMFDTPTHRDDIKRQIRKAKSHQLRRGIP